MQRVMTIPSSSRALGIVLCLTLLLAPALGEAQTRREARREPARTDTTGGGTRLAGLIGFEADGDTGLALRGDVEMDIQPLTTGWLSGVLSLGYSRFSDDSPNFDVTTNLFKIAPALRYTLKVAPQLGVYGDGGLGIYWASTNVEDRFGFDDDDDDVGILIRLGFGGFFEVSPTVRLGAEFAVTPYFGDFDETTVSLLFGASFRL